MKDLSQSPEFKVRDTKLPFQEPCYFIPTDAEAIYSHKSRQTTVCDLPSHTEEILMIPVHDKLGFTGNFWELRGEQIVNASNKLGVDVRQAKSVQFDKPRVSSSTSQECPVRQAKSVQFADLPEGVL